MDDGSLALAELDALVDVLTAPTADEAAEKLPRWERLAGERYRRHRASVGISCTCEQCCRTFKVLDDAP